MKKIKKVLLTLIIILMSITFTQDIVKADSGLESNYETSGSIAEFGIGSSSPGFSVIGELLKTHPGEKDYKTCHIIISIICILVLFIVTYVNIIKLISRRKRDKKKTLTILGISLIPTLLFSLFCLLTEQELGVYIFLLILYIIPVVIITKIIYKKNLKNKVKKIKEIDKDFAEEDFNKKSFEVYKEVQIAWMNFDLNKLKKLISDEMYDKYKVQLEKLKNDKQQNIMEEIEFKKNKITDIEVENNIEIVECEMKVTCIDYIIGEEQKVKKGKKNKKVQYSYRLLFNKELKNNKLILVNKKLLKQS